jgi:succinate dehydrogenase/fumarate reductase flavoprotein subunit
VDHVSLVRDASGIHEASRTLDDVACQARELRGRTAGEAARVLELRAGVDCARTIAASALFRQESRGAHWRSDFPETSPDWLGSVFLTWPEGQKTPELTFRPKK